MLFTRLSYKEHDSDFNSCYDFNFNAYIFYLTGEPISQHLLCYRAFAVKNHSFIPCASHLQRPRLVNNPG
ncbi:MAG TPA: hypothetical protein ENL46_03160 [Candidatus Aminicenantes bacterium]|nr:hypothetical protein [Candidatus Aminicenantes bacterium]